MFHSRSISPRSMTSSGLRPSKASFGVSSQRGTSSGRRVGPGVAPRASHRSVLAQLRHTARQATASPPRCAVRGRYRDKGLRLGVLALVPDRGPVARPSLPSAGSSRDEFPDFTGTMEGSDSCCPVSPDSCARPAIPPRAWLFAPALPRRRPSGPGGFGFGTSEGRSKGRGRAAGLSGCWGTLVGVRRVLGPRQAPGARPVQHPGTAPPLVQTVGALREA